MTVKGHILLAAPIAFGVSQMLQIYDTGALITYAFGVLIGTTLPDIDEPESYIGSRFYGLAFVIKKLNRHRGA
jgi:inner membrane protein